MERQTEKLKILKRHLQLLDNSEPILIDASIPLEKKQANGRKHPEKQS
jgi:hypothetical protein